MALLSLSLQSAPAFALPDLRATANVVATYASGDPVTIGVTVTRTGDSLTQGTYVSAKLYWSADSTWDAGDTVLWSSNDSTPDFSNAVLNSNGTRTVNAPVTIPSAAPGTYYIIAFADPANLHSESNETNNYTAYAVNIASATTQEWSFTVPAGEQQIPIGGSKAFYVPVTGAPAESVITKIEAKFDYVATGGVQSYVSARFNRAFDPGMAQGQVLVSQGALAEGNPGTFGYLSYPTAFDTAAVNTNYFFRFALGTSSPSTATIQKIYVRITYIIPAYDYRFVEVISRNSPGGWSLIRMSQSPAYPDTPNMPGRATGALFPTIFP